ncbi:MAG: sugar-transfer associated ATP-grasp domain-containing protein [Gammaproteobacteria bacterium]|nr:sugar-transfer associated ATP-grasp domain-containing protein [Gammaproteobacteria bacterium]
MASLPDTVSPGLHGSAATELEEEHIVHWKRSDPGLLWSGWLARARGDASGLRRWRLWIWWSAPMTRRERAQALLGLLLFPPLTIREAWRCVRRCGGKVRDRHGIRAQRQVLDILGLAFGAGLPPIAYYKYQLFLSERRALAHQYVEDAGRFLLVLAARLPPAPDARVGANKGVFAHWCREQGFPVVHSLLEVDGERIVSHAALPATDLFSKPENWRAGKGVELWRHVPAGGESRWQGRDGEALDVSALEQRLREHSRAYGRPIVLQPFLVNHPVIRALGNGTLCTLRVMTVRHHPGSAQALLAVLRIGTGDAQADNFDLGGLATAIDLESGRCGKAITKRGDYPVERLSANPDSGVRIEGVELPHWREAIALAARAHEQLQYGMPVMGWDIAILADGPVFIEANRFPGGNIAQMPTGLPLGASAFAPCVVDALKKGFRVR